VEVVVEVVVDVVVEVVMEVVEVVVVEVVVASLDTGGASELPGVEGGSDTPVDEGAGG